MKTTAMAILLLFSIIRPVVSQENLATVPRKLCLVMIFSGNMKEEEKTILGQTILIKISELPSLTIVEPIVKLSQDLPADQKKAKAESLGTDCYLTIKITGEKSRVLITYASFDLLENKAAIGEKSFERDRELKSLHQNFWLPLIADLGSSYKSITGKVVIDEIRKFTGEQSVVEEAKGIKVVIAAQPGTKLSGIGKTTYVADEEGLAKLELPRSSTYELYATCAGYYPVRKQFYVGTDPIRIELDQNPGSLFGIELFLAQIDYIGAGFRYYYVPDRFFIDLKTTLFMWKLIWPANNDKNRYEAPLMHLSFLTGFYFNNEDELFRLSLSAGFFLRISDVESLGIVLDPVSKWGITLLSTNLEVSTLERVRFYIEHCFNIYVTDNGDLFKASLSGNNSGNSAPGYIIGNKAVLDFLDFKIGMRLQL